MPTPIRIYFDFADPLSYVASRSPSVQGASLDEALLEWVGFELAPPPSPIGTWDDPLWAPRRLQSRSGAETHGLRLEPPVLVPWTRKAHELHLHAAAHGAAPRVRAAIFSSFFELGRDIGRVDVLVEIAASCGLEPTETKAVLDVDRYEEAVVRARRRALETGVTDVPCHFSDGRLGQGFPDLTDLSTLLPHD